MFIPNLLSAESGGEIPLRARIAIVEDEPDLREAVAEYLAANGFDVATAADAAEMRALAATEAFHLAVLDIAMPGEDGLSLGRWLRSKMPIGIIFASAAGTTIDRIVGLEIGADDYMPKPGNPRELVARIRAVLRRGRTPPGAPREAGGRVVFGGCVLDLGARTLHRDGREQRMTTGEFAVLAALVQRPRQALTRDQLMSAARGREHDAFDRSMDVMVSRLRKLIEDDPKHPRWLQTVWGTGYVFVPEDAA